MLESLKPLLAILPPRNSRAMTEAIRRCGDTLDRGPDWVRRWIAFTIVGDALASHGPQGEPQFQFKGGAAIELRLRRLAITDATSTAAATTPAPQPRTTRDLDSTFCGPIADVEVAVRTALAVPRHGFAFRVEIETPDAPFMRRFSIRVAYQERRLGMIHDAPFSNVQLEVSAYEGTLLAPDFVPAFSLRAFGIDGPATLPCIPLRKQIAQKLHAVTEQIGGKRKNDRFRDLVDLVLLSALEPAFPALREACVETFQLRNKQRWPPDIVADETWLAPMEKLAAEMGLDSRPAEVIVARVRAYVLSIDAAR